MKKEDFTTRLLKLFFHIQGPFDECRQEMIYDRDGQVLERFSSKTDPQTIQESLQKIL